MLIKRSILVLFFKTNWAGGRQSIRPLQSRGLNCGLSVIFLLNQQKGERGRCTYPPSQDLIDGGALLQRALGDHIRAHLFHVEHEGV